MGRTAPRGDLRSSRQAPASDAQTQKKPHPNPRPARARVRPAAALRPVGAPPALETGTSPADLSSLSPEEFTLHLDCVKLTEERLPLGIAYPRFLEVVRRAVPFDFGTLYLAEGPAGALIPAAIKGNRVELADQVRFARGPGLSAWVAQEGRPVIIPHPVHSADQQPFADKGLRAFVAIPMMHGRWVTGVLALSRAEQVFALQEYDHLVRSSERLATTLSRLRLEAQYRAWTRTDPETGLSARHHFAARLDTELNRARHQASEFSVAVVALHGLEPADSVGGIHSEKSFVQLVAEGLQSSIRSCDMAALLDEHVFGILLAGVAGETAEVVLRRIATTMLHGIPDLAPAGRSVQVWGGLAAFGEAVMSPEELVACARGRLQPIEQRSA